MKSKNTTISSFLAYTMAGALCLSAGACSESSEMGEGKYIAALSPHKLAIESSGSTYLKSADEGYTFACSEGAKTYTFKITAENTPWTITGAPSWMSISPTSGDSDQSVGMKVEANTPTETQRSATIILKSNAPDWEYSIPITVTQAAASPKLETVNRFGNFSSSGETKDCEFSANFSPSIAYEDNDGNWISATAERSDNEYYGMPGYTLHVTAKPNEATSSRTGYVLLQYDGKTIQKVGVSQYAFYPSSSVSNSYLYISAEGATKTITYEANFIPTLQYDEVKEWCEASLDTDTKTITLKVKQNKAETIRSGYIYLMYNGKKMESINVYQYAFSPSASFSDNYRYIDKNGGTLTVDYTANVIPTLKYDEWCEASINTSTKKVTIHVQPNTRGRARLGYVYLIYNGKQMSSLRISQDQ